MDLAAYERYLLLERGHTPRGVCRYLQDLRLWRDFLQESGLPPGQEAVRRLLETRAPKPRRTQGLLAAIRSYYLWERDVLGRPVEDPTHGVARPRAGRRLVRYPSSEEVAHLLEATAQEREAALLRSLIGFLYGTGLRLSEVLSLRLEGLVWQEGEPVALQVLGKGDKERLVPLSPTAQEALQAWLPLRGGLRRGRSSIGTDCVRAPRGPLFVFLNPAKPSQAGQTPSPS